VPEEEALMVDEEEGVDEVEGVLRARRFLFLSDFRTIVHELSEKTWIFIFGVLSALLGADSACLARDKTI